MKKEPLLNSALVILSIIVALFLSEILYRSFVVLSYTQKASASDLNVTLLSDSLIIYDHQYGYSYNPNKEINAVSIVNNKAISCSPQFTINEFGTFEKDVTDFRKAQENTARRGPRILVFGDSFAAATRNGETWVSLFSKRFKERLDHNAQILNFGRDGYGILQMLQLAAGQIETWKPDIILFTFITNDLARKEFWRKTVMKGERGYSFVIYDPTEDERSLDSVTFSVIDKRITKQWCERVMKNGGKDPLIASMAAFYKKVRNEELDKFAPDYFAAQSYLFNKLVYGQPIIRSSKFRNENVSFQRSSRLKAAIDKLNKSGIPYYFVHLPMLHEMEKDVEWLPSPDDLRLTNELFSMTGPKQILFLGNYLHLSKDQLARFPLNPNDPHPSADGIRYYADAMINLYLDKDKIGMQKPLWTGEVKPVVLNDLINRSPLLDSPEGWGPGFAKATGQGPGVVVGPGPLNPNVFAQQFSAKPNEQFKIVARASVPKATWDVFGVSKSTAMGRFQINWLDAKGKYITSYVKSFEVTSEEKTFETYVITPEGAVSGLLYVVADGAEDVVRYTEMRLLGKRNPSKAN